MIWPGRRLALALFVPALLSLGLFVSPALRGAVFLLDLAVVAVALVDLFSLVGAGSFRAERRHGVVGSLGEPLEIELSLENLGPVRRSLRMRDDVPDTFSTDRPEFLVTIPGNSVATMPYKATPLRRGTYEFSQVDALVTSRRSFWRRSVSVPCVSALRVYPDVRQIARYTVLARRDKLSTLGLRRSRKLGTDNEFERLRDYIEGDDPRHLDWRATARRRKLTVRAHQFNQSQRLIFLIDCGRMMAGDTGGGLSPLDHALNAMLMLAHVALIRGDQVGLLAFSDGIKAYVPPGGGPHRINRIVHSVHNLFPELVEPRFDRAFVELEKRCRKRSLVILMSNLFDDVNAQIVADHMGNVVGRHLPLAVFLRDHDIFALADGAPEHGPGLYKGAAAAALLNWRERAIAGLRLRGVLTLDAFPDDLTAPLINQYLQIKARHLL
jgi:uncharacterized protein (DUF58 family)